MQKQSPSRAFAPGALILLVFFVLVVLFPVVPTVEARVEAEDLKLLSSPGRYNAIGAEDIDGDGNIEVVFGDYNGYVTFLEFDRVTKDFLLDEDLGMIEIDSNRVWGLELADIDPDEDGTEVIVGDGKGEIFVFSGKTAEKLAYYEGISRDAHGLFIYDYDEDGDLDIGVGTQFKNDDPNGMFYMLDYKEIKDHTEGVTKDKPRPFFMTAKANSRWRGVDVGDVDKDGKAELILGCGAALGDVSGEGYLRVFNPDPAEHADPLAAKSEWESEDLGGCVQGVAAVDIDNDGDLEIVCSVGYRYNDGWIYIFEYDGRGGYEEVWKSGNVGPKPFGFIVEDVDNDGVLEIIVGNQPGYIYIVDGLTRETEWKSPLLGTDVMGFTTVDLDTDTAVEIIAAQGGYQGKGDYTSGYTTPHIYVIDGITHEIEYTLGEKDYVQFTLQIVLLLTIIIFLLEVSVLTKIIATSVFRKKKRGGP